MGVFVIMEYTKDILLNISYSDDTQIVKIKKEKLFRRIFNVIYENKLITVILMLTILLVAMDLIFVMNFINILSIL